MRFSLFSFLILIMCSFAFSQNQANDYEFQRFLEIQEKSLRNRDVSPLLPKDFENFKRLDYFAFDTKYRVTAQFVKTTEEKFFLMPTSTGGTRKYLKIGDLSFKIDGKNYSLNAFSTNLADLFIPFKDLTNAVETNNSGRYVYVRLPKNGSEIILDFNLSHNPNCAYNSNFSCTLPPKENFLQIEIKAGEKKFVSLKS